MAMATVVMKECNHCYKGNCKEMCGRCRTPYYCSRECQVADWPEHRLYCTPTAKDLPRAEDMGHYYGPGEPRRLPHREAMRQQIHQKVLEVHGKVPHCAICGDVQEQCQLKRALNTVICVDCLRIQSCM